MNITLIMTDDDGTVHVSRNEIEYLGDYADFILDATRAIGYHYVKQVAFVKDGGDEIWSR